MLLLSVCGSKTAPMPTPTFITIKPHHGGWKVVESPGVEPYFSEWDKAITHATNRARMRKGGIRIFGHEGPLLETRPIEDPDSRY